MGRFQTWEARFALREFAIVSLAGLAAFLFINHENLYFRGPFVLARAPIESYFLATIVIYLFLRLLIIAAEVRVPPAHTNLVRCPECGEWLDVPAPAGREAHHTTEVSPKPTEKTIISAVALRKAVDVARTAAQTPRNVASDDLAAPTGEFDNTSSEDLLAALDDPDLLERLRHSPHPPRDPRFKR